MLDPKHKNIGATVSMINIIAQKEADEIAESFKGNGIGAVMAGLLGDIDELFMAEASECDYKHETGQCTFHAEEDLLDALQAGNSSITFPCCVGECPLGALVDKELKGAANSIDLSKPLSFGADPDQTIDFGPRHQMSPEFHRAVGSHHHIGYTGWRKHWHAFKGVVKDMAKNWKIYAAATAAVILVNILSKWAGTLSSYLW